MYPNLVQLWLHRIFVACPPCVLVLRVHGSKPTIPAGRNLGRDASPSIHGLALARSPVPQYGGIEDRVSSGYGFWSRHPREEDEAIHKPMAQTYSA